MRNELRPYLRGIAHVRGIAFWCFFILRSNLSRGVTSNGWLRRSRAAGGGWLELRRWLPDSYSPQGIAGHVAFGMPPPAPGGRVWPGTGTGGDRQDRSGFPLLGIHADRPG